jgi:cyclopropane fatty-acyl-phospholipid synthase-like methyltransferase
MHSTYNKNLKFWNNLYYAPNVESLTFRFYGRILKNISLKKNLRLLDFGSGMGAASNYFSSKSFKVVGCDITKQYINFYNKKNPLFQLVSPDPNLVKYYGWQNGIDVIYAMQSLYYFTKEHFYLCVNKLYNSLKKGGIFFATFKTINDTFYYKNSKRTEDPWLRHVKFKNSRLNVDLKQFFVKNKSDLISRLPMFKPLFIGHYSMQLTENEGPGEHLIFCGIKK